MARTLILDADGQGGLQSTAALTARFDVYQLASYRRWETKLHRSDFSMGQFGENFPVEGLADDDACIGDQ